MSGQFIAEIDGLRFIAIMSVFLFHLGGVDTVMTRRFAHDPLAVLLSRGDAGVMLFFIISGFVIALPFARAHLFGERLPRLRAYFARRLTRLEPPYIVSLLFLFFLLPFTRHRTLQFLLPHFLASAFYQHNLIYGTMSPINVVAWSLEVEFQFYVLAPAIATLFLIGSKTWRRIVLAALIAAFATLSLVVGTGAPRFVLSLPHNIQFFLTGFLLCDVYLVDWRSAPQPLSRKWDAVSLAAWVAIPAVLLFLDEAGMFFVPALAFVAYFAAFKGTWSNRFFRHPLIYTIGGMCYTIYLYHLHMLGAFDRIFRRVPQFQAMPLWLTIIVTAVIEVPVILLVCAGLFIAIEKPCMKKYWYKPFTARLSETIRLARDASLLACSRLFSLR